jgi:predicted O-methyltransferase YrrM
LTTDGRYRTYRGNILQRLGVQRQAPELSGSPEMPVWMHPIEFSQIRAVLHAVAPRTMVEWGSGGSSRAWLEALPDLELLFSVEHDAKWAERVRASITDPRFHLELCPPPPELPEPVHIPRNHETGQRHEAWTLRLEHEPEHMRHYVDAPAAAGVRFDVALVDGRARIHCLRKAFELVRPGGVVLLHDAQRPVYRQTLHALGRPLLLEPWVQGQVCVLRTPDA